LKILIGIISAVLGCCIIIFWYNKQSDLVEVNDKLVMKMAAGVELDSYSIFPPPKFANVQGEVVNKSNEPISNVNLIYSIGHDTLNIIIGYISAGDKVSFASNEIKVNSSSPGYSLLEIRLGN
jgi:hypothetical protein